MAYDYSYRELQRMQEDAIRRVQEMQSRATLPLETESEPEEVKETPISKEKPPEQKTVRTRQVTPHRVRHRPGDRTSKIPDKINDILGNNELSEQTLLIAIIMLLVNEKADNILILAILYILAD